MSKIQESLFIELYKEGKDDLELAKLFKVGERSIQRLQTKLRKAGKIGYRKELPATRTVSVAPVPTQDYKPLDWKITETKKIKDKNVKFSSYLVVADQHIPYANESAVKSVLNLMSDVAFDGFIILGDYMDMTPISHWLQDGKKNMSLENKRLYDDYVEGNKLLDEFDKRLPKNCDKRFFFGNHERFYYDLIEKFPALEGMFEPTRELKLKERGYKVYNEINHIERIGKLNFTHGIYTSQNFVRKHIDELKTNVMFGHLHSPRLEFASSPAKEIAIAGYSIGCLCDLSPAYMKNQPNKWSHGFAVVNFYNNNEYFDVDLKRIVHGTFIYNNKLYSGAK